MRKAPMALLIVPLLWVGTGKIMADNDQSGHAKPLYAATKPHVTKVDLVGEVVDSWCFSSGVMGPGRGPRHNCGLACAMGGVTLGIVDDNNVLYIAAKHQGYTGCQDLLTPFMAERVHIKGWLAESGGCKLLKIATVERAK
jgi:hypothetical protein